MKERKIEKEEDWKRESLKEKKREKNDHLASFHSYLKTPRGHLNLIPQKKEKNKSRFEINSSFSNANP